MFSNVPNRYGVKSTRPSLKLKKRMQSLERQSSAREEAVAEVRNTSEQSPEEEFWIDDHFQQMLKTLVREVVEAENEFYAMQERVKRLQDSKSERKVPSGTLNMRHFHTPKRSTWSICGKRTTTNWKVKMPVKCGPKLLMI